MRVYIFVFNLLVFNNFNILSYYCKKNNKNNIISTDNNDNNENNENNEKVKINKDELDKLDDKYKNDVDFKYLSKNLKNIEDIKKYIDIKNLYSDEIPDISNIKDITTNEILSFLKIDEAKNEIDKCGNINEKVKKLAEIIFDDYKNKRYTFENSNLLVPRCLIAHENNNCVLEAYFSYLEGNPYACKFFLILNNLFENNDLNKINLPVTYEVCQFFKNAIDHPNFNDKISCLKISKTWYDNVEKLKNKMDSNLKKGIKDYLEDNHFGGFQINRYIFIIMRTIYCELKDYYDFFYNFKKDNNIPIFNIIPCTSLPKKKTSIWEVNEKNCNEYLFKDIKNNTFTAYIFTAIKYHNYTIRNINGIFFNYDSLIYDKPKVISNKDIVKIYLNLQKNLNNFNGNYSDHTINLVSAYTDFFVN